MTHICPARKVMRYRFGMVGLVAALLLFQSQAGHAGGWDLRHGHASPATQGVGDVEALQKEAVTQDLIGAETETQIVVPLATSSTPKLFWFDCAGSEKCSSTSLYYVDPAAATPAKTLFDSGVFLGTLAEDRDGAMILSGSVNPTDYTITNASTAYIVYIKGGKIFKVDTTTLAKTQVSSETNLLPGTLCQFETFIDWSNPLNSSIFYSYLGSGDAVCNNGDEAMRLVKLSMGATTAPLNIGKKNVLEQLFDGRYFVEDWSTGTHKIRVCNASFSSCADVTTRQNTSMSWWTEDVSASHVIFRLDGKLMSYNYGTSTLKTLFTPVADQSIIASTLDKDGYVYFMTGSLVSPFTNQIRKVSANGGTMTNLASFSTAASLAEAQTDLRVTPTHVVYIYPNATRSGANAYSVPKAGGAPVLLSDALVSGGPVGSVFFYEDASGKVNRRNLDGTGLVSKANAQLLGASLGGSADYFYEFVPATARMLVAGIDNKLRSYASTDNIADSAAGTVLGTIPVNLSNAGGFDVGSNMLLAADRRNAWFSAGSDILLIKAATAASLKRLTNSNSGKAPLTRMD